MIPSLSLGELAIGGRKTLRHIAGARRSMQLRSGRLAIAKALATAGIGKDDEVLVPAYHCTSMLEPIEALGAVPLLYRITENLQADMDDIRRRAGTRVKAAIGVHFYGVISDFVPLRAFCTSAGISFVEDCAHCFSYSSYSQPIGEHGDFVVTSPRKFLPIWDGGEIIFSDHKKPGGRRVWPDVKYDLKAAKNTIEFSAASARFGDRIFSHFQSSTTSTEPQEAESSNLRPHSQGEDATSTNYEDPRFEFRKVEARNSLSGALILRLLNLRDVIVRRRRNFDLLLEECEGLRNGRVLAPGMDRCETPYVFPLYVDRGDAVYTELRRAGVPMWRWDECRVSDCSVSIDYGRQVIQFPCHQGITRRQVGLMGALIRKVVG